MVQVSILVPVYKCENFVYKCADSLFSQTFEDVEFIFYDDCSPDRSVQVIESCLKNILIEEIRLGLFLGSTMLVLRQLATFYWQRRMVNIFGI